MANEPINENLSYQEFMSLAMQNKIMLIDHLAAKLLATGSAAAAASAEYYRIKLGSEKGDARLAEATATRAALEGEYDALKHAVSALQSTLRAEREMDK